MCIFIFVFIYIYETGFERVDVPEEEEEEEEVRPSSGCPPPCRNPRPSVRNSGCNNRGSRCPRPVRRSDSSSLTNGGTRHSWSNACATRGSSRSSAPQRTPGSRNARTRARLSVSGPPEASRRCWNDRQPSQYSKLKATILLLRIESKFSFGTASRLRLEFRSFGHKSVPIDSTPDVKVRLFKNSSRLDSMDSFQFEANLTVRRISLDLFRKYR